MRYWIVPSNNERFRLDDFLNNYNVVSWRHTNNFQVGDVVFIYATKPRQRLTYQMIITEVNVPESKYDETNYWGDKYKIKRKLLCTINLVTE